MEKRLNAHISAGQSATSATSILAAIGFSLFWACLFSMMARNSFLDMATETLWYHLVLRILLFCAFGATALALARRRKNGAALSRERTRTLAGAAALYAALAIASAATFYATGEAHALAFDVVVWAVSGTCLCCLLFLWIPLLAKLPDGTLGACLALATGGGAALYLVANLLPRFASTAALAACVLASIGLYAVLRRDPALAACNDANIPFSQSRANAHLSWAFGLIYVIYGIVFGLGAGSLSQLKHGPTLYVGIAAAIALGALGASLFMKHSRGKVPQSEVLRMLFPALIIALVPMSFFSGTVYVLCNLVLIGCYAFLVTVSIRFELRGARDRNAAPTYFVGMSQAALCGGLAGGFALGLLPSATGSLDFSLLSAVALGLVVALAALSTFAQNKMAHLQQAEAQEEAHECAYENESTLAPHIGPWKAHCTAVAQDAGLSARETDVFLLLAKGRGIEHIQNKLCISSHTVKTHVSNIYRKMNVSSREELIDLVEASKGAR